MLICEDCGDSINPEDAIMIDGEAFCSTCAEDHGTDDIFDFGESFEQED